MVGNELNLLAPHRMETKVLQTSPLPLLGVSLYQSCVSHVLPQPCKSFTELQLFISQTHENLRVVYRTPNYHHCLTHQQIFKCLWLFRETLTFPGWTSSSPHFAVRNSKDVTCLKIYGLLFHP